MVLVSAFAGAERIKEVYRHAVQARYRFFSYGDAMLLEAKPGYEIFGDPSAGSCAQGAF